MRKSRRPRTPEEIEKINRGRLRRQLRLVIEWDVFCWEHIPLTDAEFNYELKSIVRGLGDPYDMTPAARGDAINKEWKRQIDARNESPYADDSPVEPRTFDLASRLEIEADENARRRADWERKPADTRSRFRPFRLSMLLPVGVKASDVRRHYDKERKQTDRKEAAMKAAEIQRPLTGKEALLAIAAARNGVTIEAMPVGAAVTVRDLVDALSRRKPFRDPTGERLAPDALRTAIRRCLDRLQTAGRVEELPARPSRFGVPERQFRRRK
jgi:hypothetical protein